MTVRVEWSNLVRIWSSNEDVMGKIHLAHMIKHVFFSADKDMRMQIDDNMADFRDWFDY